MPAAATLGLLFAWLLSTFNTILCGRRLEDALASWWGQYSGQAQDGSENAALLVVPATVSGAADNQQAEYEGWLGGQKGWFALPWNARKQSGVQPAMEEEMDAAGNRYITAEEFREGKEGKVRVQTSRPPPPRKVSRSEETISSRFARLCQPRSGR